MTDSAATPRAQGDAPDGRYERAVDLAAEAVTDGWALFRDPRYGTELLLSEVREIVAKAIEVFCEEVGNPLDLAQENERAS